MKLKIAFVSQSPAIWGAERSLLSIATEVDSGFQIQLDLYSASADLVAQWPEQKGAATLITSSSTRAFVTAAREELVRNGPYEAIVLFSVESLLLKLAMPKARIVLDLHDSFPSRSGRLKLNVAAVGCADIIAISDFVAAQLRGRPAGRVVTISRSVHSAERLVPVEAESKYGVLGRLDRDKNVLLVLKAMTLTNTMQHIVVRGDSFGDQNARREVQEFGRTRLPGRFTLEPATDVDSAFLGLKAVIVGRTDEPMGRTVLEAHARGLPALVPDTGGSSELVKHGVDGLVYKAGDASSLAKALEAMEDGLTWQRLCDGAMNSHSARPSLEEYSLNYLKRATGKAPNWPSGA